MCILRIDPYSTVNDSLIKVFVFDTESDANELNNVYAMMRYRNVVNALYQTQRSHSQTQPAIITMSVNRIESTNIAWIVITCQS